MTTCSHHIFAVSPVVLAATNLRDVRGIAAALCRATRPGKTTGQRIHPKGAVLRTRDRHVAFEKVSLSVSASSNLNHPNRVQDIKRAIYDNKQNQ